MELLSKPSDLQVLAVQPIYKTNCRCWANEVIPELHSILQRVACALQVLVSMAFFRNYLTGLPAFLCSDPVAQKMCMSLSVSKEDLVKSGS